jgi:hypothetical protein
VHQFGGEIELRCAIAHLDRPQARKLPMSVSNVVGAAVAAVDFSVDRVKFVEAESLR